MTREHVESFFRLLSETYPKPLRVLLIGGGASIVQTVPRDTEDLDFEIRTSLASPVSDEDQPALVAAIDRAKTSLRIKVQYADEVDRWSRIPWPNYQRHARLWKRFGDCSVWVLKPELYAISKLVRGIDSDYEDIERVMRTVPASWKRLAALAGRALREAPMSDTLAIFRQQVERFFRESGPKVWGKDFDPDRAIAAFATAYRRKPVKR